MRTLMFSTISLYTTSLYYFMQRNNIYFNLQSNNKKMFIIFEEYNLISR